MAALTWTCEACEFANTHGGLFCALCDKFKDHGCNDNNNNQSTPLSQWNCIRCTYLNSNDIIQCEMCNTNRCDDNNHNNNNNNNDNNSNNEDASVKWKCNRCTYLHDNDAIKCEICNTNRYDDDNNNDNNKRFSTPSMDQVIEQKNKENQDEFENNDNIPALEPVSQQMEVDGNNMNNDDKSNSNLNSTESQQQQHTNINNTTMDGDNDSNNNNKDAPSHRVHLYSSKKRKGRKNNETDEKKIDEKKMEAFEFEFVYDNMHRKLFGNEYIPLIEEDECDDDITTFINNKLKDISHDVPEIDHIHGWIDGLKCQLFEHQQFGVKWLIKMEQNELFRGGYLCDEMGVGKTVQIIALMLLTKHNEKYTVKHEGDEEYEYYHGGDEELDVSDFIVNNKNIEDQDSEFVVNNEDIEDQKLENEECKHSEFVDENKKKRKWIEDEHDEESQPDLKRRKLMAMVNEDDLNIKRKKKKQRTLIIVPLCLLDQWEEEIQSKAPYEFNVLIYHGSARKRLKIQDLLEYDVIITTYSIIASDYNKANDIKYDNTFFDKQDRRMRGLFYRIVLDEAHTIKNPNSWKSKAVTVLANRGCKVRWVLTGTPIQNGLFDLFSLGRFLQLPQFGDLMSFKEAFCIKSQKGNRFNKDENERATQIKVCSFLSIVMLRRLKSEVIDDLVSKTEEWIEVDFNQETRTLYDQFEDNARNELQDAIDSGTVNKSWNNILLQLLRLRQICSNPDVARLNQGLCTFSFCKRDKRILDKAFKIKACGHMFCSEHLEIINGKCPVEACRVTFNWNANSQDLEDLPDTKCVFAQKWREIIYSQSNVNGTIIQMIQVPILIDKFGYDLASIIKGYLYENEHEMDAYIVRKQVNKAKGIYIDNNDNVEIENKEQIKYDDIREKVSWNKKDDDDTLDGYENEKICRQHYDFTFIPSAKTNILIKKIMDIKINKPHDKILIYSQFTSMLDLIQIVLNKYQIPFYRYDGSLSYNHRKNTINNFKQYDDKKVMLMSLKCGALGLNLMTANHVIFIDLWWNPMVEAQAIDRVHRIGQKKHVFVTRFVIKNSVQDRMLQIQKEKQHTADFVLTGAKLFKSNVMNVDMLQTLFGNDNDA